MVSVVRSTIPITDLALEVTRLRNDGFDRFLMAIFPHNRKFIEVKAWHYSPRPDKRKVSNIEQVS